MGIVATIKAMFSKSVTPVAPPTTMISQGSGAAARRITLTAMKPITITRDADNRQAITQDGQVRYVFPSLGALTITQSGTWPKCGPKPAAETRTVQCPAGSTGSYVQTRDYVPAPYPECWRVTDWAPAAPPAGACTPITPPPGRFAYDLSNVDLNGVPFHDFIAFCNRLDEPLAYDLIIAYKLTGNASYRTRALALIDAQVAEAQADIDAGRNPRLTGDNYLYADGNFITPAAFCVAFGDPSAAQLASWRRVYDQAIFNIWNWRQASWGGRPENRDNGWGSDNPFNNYNMHFMRATTAWALATNNADTLAKLRNELWPSVIAAMNTISGGGSIEGTGYGYAYTVLYDAMKLWRDSGQGDLAGNLTQLANTIRFWAHAAMPGLVRFLPIGDQPRDSEPKFYDYYRALLLGAVNLTHDSVSALIGDWLLSHMTPQHAQVYRGNFVDDLEPYIVTNNAPSSCVFRAAECGMIAARTSWSDDAIGVWIIAGMFSESHMGQEQGQFTFWGSRQWLAVTNNIWSRSGIHQSTEDKNVVAFYDSDGKRIDQLRYREPDVSSYSANQETGDTHLVLDLSVMYGHDSGVYSWIRQIDFVGGVLTIKDIVDLAEGFTAKFQLNTPVAPVRNQNRVTAGKLQADFVGASGYAVVDMLGDDIDDYRSGFRTDATFSSTLTTTLRVLP